MTTTASVSAAATAQPRQAAQTSGLNRSTLDYDAFLKLLVAQMQNQDPMAPMDSTEYVAQLASFSNVEQGLKLNAKLDQLLIQSEMVRASGMIGKTVTSADGGIKGEVASVRIDDAGSVATLRDGRTISLGSGVTIEA